MWAVRASASTSPAASDRRPAEARIAGLDPVAELRGAGLVEGLVVVLTLCILAFVAIPPYMERSEQARVRKLTEALNRLAVLQERHFSSERRFAADLEQLQFEQPDDAQLLVMHASDDGWSARGRDGASERTCAVFYGNAPPVAPASVPGVITCDR